MEKKFVALGTFIFELSEFCLFVATRAIPWSKSNSCVGVSFGNILSSCWFDCCLVVVWRFVLMDAR